MESKKFNRILCKKQAFQLFFHLKKKLRNFYSKIVSQIRRRFTPKVLIGRFHKKILGLRNSDTTSCVKPVRVASFNAALFAGAPVLSNTEDVKAEEEKGMQPLSSLAESLGMKYVFAESWAPEYGNAILSKWPIKKWTVQKILEHEDIRNVLKATIDVPWSGEIDVYCTQLDNLDESWRMKQIKAIIQSSERPHILAGGLNSLERSDYNSGRWMDIIKYFEDIGKPKPKAEVMKMLKMRGYEDAVEYAGDCEPVVIATKGQNVQGTCKYGTRVDYIMSSPNASYNFIPGSYSVISSKGISDHHIVKVDIIKGDAKNCGNNTSGGYFRSNQKVVRLGSPCAPRGSWSMER